MPLQALLALLLLAPPSRAQPQYEGLPVPPDEIYDALLDCAERGDHDRAGRALKHIRPLTDAVRADSGVDVPALFAAAAAEGRPEALESAVRALIVYDLRLLVREYGQGLASGAPGRQRSRLVKQIAVLYAFLSPESARREPAADREIWARLKAAARAAEEDGRAAEARPVLMKTLEAIRRAFPEIPPPSPKAPAPAGDAP